MDLADRGWPAHAPGAARRLAPPRGRRRDQARQLGAPRRSRRRRRGRARRGRGLRARPRDRPLRAGVARVGAGGPRGAAGGARLRGRGAHARAGRRRARGGTACSGTRGSRIPRSRSRSRTRPTTPGSTRGGASTGAADPRSCGSRAGILERGPALYAAVRERDASADGSAPRVLATARLALVDGWGGLFAVATRPEARRRGLSRAAMGAVVRAGLDRGISALWLQVVEENAGARALYSGLGFAPVSRYAYWTQPTG
ncbi:GNAT family N-acetyltransferase [Clavibacter zhangzhiyongii]|uniref:GNAT family N-acetyltransferase n=1 Tax=Clavibacter zhangzhiyongii TaxID=2768071 RepID=UPI0039E14E17